MTHFIDALKNLGIILLILTFLCYALVFFWYKEKASESLLSDIFFTVVFFAVAYVIAARKTGVVDSLWSAFAIFSIVTALKLIYQAITRRLEKRFSKAKEKYSLIIRRRRLKRFKRSHIFHLKVKNKKYHRTYGIR